MALKVNETVTGTLDLDEFSFRAHRVQDGDVEVDGVLKPKYVNVVTATAELEGGTSRELSVCLPFSDFTAVEKDALRSVRQKCLAALKALVKVS